MSAVSPDPAAPLPPLRPDAAVMGLVGLAHCISHFSQLLLPPLFPWLKEAFHVSYAELGLLMTIFFVVSCAVQALSGFVVDRFGPRPVLFGGMALLAAGGVRLRRQHQLRDAGVLRVVAGIGNGVFHPVDYTLLNRKVQRRGSAMRSACTASPAASAGRSRRRCWCRDAGLAWRVALASAGALALAVLVVLWLNRVALTLEIASAAAAGERRAERRRAMAARLPDDSRRSGCASASSSSTRSSSAASRRSRPRRRASCTHVPAALAALCLTFYMVASAGGMVLGGFLVADPSRCERIVGIGFGVAGAAGADDRLCAAGADGGAGAVRVMGFAAGIAGPSRDLLVKRAAPANATGRVYGVVYSGLDIGQAIAPLLFGPLMDLHRPSDVWLGIALVQGLLIVSAFNVRERAPDALARRRRPGQARAGAAGSTRLRPHVRCRSMQVASTSPPAAATSSRVEKISTSL